MSGKFQFKDWDSYIDEAVTIGESSVARLRIRSAFRRLSLMGCPPPDLMLRGPGSNVLFWRPHQVGTHVRLLIDSDTMAVLKTFPAHSMPTGNTTVDPLLVLFPLIAMTLTHTDLVPEPARCV